MTACLCTFYSRSKWYVHGSCWFDFRLITYECYSNSVSLRFPVGCCVFLLSSISGYLGRDYGKLIGRYFYDLMEWVPHSGSRDVRCSQEKVESVTGAQFTQSDSGDSNPICFGRRGCSQWFGCDWSFLCPWSHHDTIPVSTFIFPLLT